MALLQISEPGQAPDPHQRRIAVGIDLGTTHSLVAAVRHGVPECLPDEDGRVILPSAVRPTASQPGTYGSAGWPDASAPRETARSIGLIGAARTSIASPTGSGATSTSGGAPTARISAAFTLASSPTRKARQRPARAFAGRPDSGKTRLARKTWLDDDREIVLQDPRAFRHGLTRGAAWSQWF